MAKELSKEEEELEKELSKLIPEGMLAKLPHFTIVEIIEDENGDD